MNTQSLLHLAQIYADHRGLKLSTVATYAARDGKFFKSLAAGSGCTLGKAARIIDYFDANWPEDLEWPAAVSRPSRKRRTA